MPATVTQITTITSDTLKFFTDASHDKNTASDLSQLVGDYKGLTISQGQLGQVLTAVLQTDCGSNAGTLANDLAGLAYGQISSDLTHNGNGLSSDLNSLNTISTLVGGKYLALSGHETTALALKQTVSIYHL
jgi:NADH:ubiquinone oxidoreductase subunit F (NADH-binding)